MKTIPVVVDGYTRRQPLATYRYTCAVCGAKHSVELPPGFRPKYCPPEPGQKLSECQRAANRRRVAAWRLKQMNGGKE